MALRGRCPVCGSKQWHKEPSSGLIACSEGHILQNYRNETNEAEDLGNHMMKKRALKSHREKEERTSRADPKLYHGSRGRYLYFQCQQLILRKQIVALTKLWNLPVEFEMICRDIWALHLSLLSEPPPDELLYGPEQRQHDNGKEKEQSMSLDGMKHDNASRYYRSHSESQSRSRSRDARLGASTPETRPSSPVPSECPSSSSSDDDGDHYRQEDRGRKANHEFRSGSGRDASEDDPELAELLWQNSESEDEEEKDLNSDGDGQKPSSSGRTGGRRKHRHDVFEVPANNIAVLVVACWTLRIPILYRDFIRHIESYDLPYLDPVRLLPRSMVVHLTKHNVQALSPARPPKTLVLHGLVSHLAKQLHRTYGIVTPEANAAPILWRVIQSLGGTPTLYNMTKRMSVKLSLPLALHHSLVPPRDTRDLEVHQYDNAPIEVSFMAAAIVVLKMVYGLDGKKRSPKDPDDPAYALPRIEDYLDLVKELQSEDLAAEGMLSNSEKPISVDEADDAKLDEYLAFCERALLRPEAEEDEEDQILVSHFPIIQLGTVNIVSGPESKARGRARLGGTAEENGGSTRPGETYTIYDSRDMFGSMGEESEIIIGRAARWTGVGEEYICGVVEKYDRRVIRRYKRGERK